MKKNDFLFECKKRCIAPEIALENQDIISALKNRDDKKVIKILNTQF